METATAGRERIVLTDPGLLLYKRSGEGYNSRLLRISVRFRLIGRICAVMTSRSGLTGMNEQRVVVTGLGAVTRWGSVWMHSGGD